MGGGRDRALCPIASVDDRANDIGNDVSGTLDAQDIADANVFARNVLKVMEGGMLDDDPADLDRF